jgi:ribonucleoside-diphosphate reductase alpha chain
MEGATFAKLTSMHFYGWKSGLKTGMYYLRTKSAVDAIKFTLKSEKKEKEVPSQSLQNAAKTFEETQSLPKNVSDDSSLSSEELKALIKQSKESEDDDCEMCGS